MVGIIPFLVIYELPNEPFHSKIVNAENEEKAREKFQTENPKAKIKSVKPYGCAH